MQAPKEEHMDAARRVICYIKGTAGQGLFLPKNSKLELVGCCDSDWGACPITQQSLTGYFISLEILIFHGKPKSKILSLDHQLKQNIDLSQKLLVSLSGFVLSLHP